MTQTPTGRDVTDVLSSDHREFLALLAQIRTAADAEERRDLADTVISEVVRHAVAEEMFVYPAMRKHLPDGDDAVAHDIEEHKELEVTMKELEAVDAGDPRFLELVDQLETILRDHVEDEENEQFTQLRAHIPRQDLVEMAGKVEAAKKVCATG